MKRLLVIIGLVLMVAMPVMADDHAGCMKSKGMERQVTNLDNGIKVSMTATDPKLVTEIQAMAAKSCRADCPMMAKNVTRTVANTQDGALITATSTDPAQVKAMQEHAAKGCGSEPGAKACGRHGDAAKVGCAHGEANKACCKHGEAGKACCKHGEAGKVACAHGEAKAKSHGCPMAEATGAAKS